MSFPERENSNARNVKKKCVWGTIDTPVKMSVHIEPVQDVPNFHLDPEYYRAGISLDHKRCAAVYFGTARPSPVAAVNEPWDANLLHLMHKSTTIFRLACWFNARISFEGHILPGSIMHVWRNPDESRHITPLWICIVYPVACSYQSMALLPVQRPSIHNCI